MLAKGKKNGALALDAHLRHVSTVCTCIAKHLDYDKKEIELAAKAGILHDIGKAHPDFQRRLLADTFQYDSNKIPLRHEISSILFLPLFPQEEWPALIDYIIAHHKSISYRAEDKLGIIMLCEEYGDEEIFEKHSAHWEEWSPAALDILQGLGLHTFPITKQQALQAFEFVVEYCYSILKKHQNMISWRKGILMAADYYASGLCSDIGAEQLFRVPDITFFSRVNSLYPLSLCSSESPKKHTLVKAPTGAGKTDFLMRRCKNRIFYTLPFQASINAMYERFKSVMPGQDIRLLHGSSVVKTSAKEAQILQGLCGASVKVLTPHQLACLATGSKGFEALAIDIKGCDIILDEIHCYSDTAQALVLEMIRVLLKLDCSIHIGTATLPTDLEYRILEILGDSDNVYTVELTAMQKDEFDRHIVYKHQNFEEVLPIIQTSCQANEKLIIVANTVDRAQAYYQRVSQEFPGVKTLLLHSRFRRQDRSELENQLYHLFENQNQPIVIISTQVIEVSLDISADRMITECAPIDALVQRFGRVNRKRSIDTPKQYKPVHVISPEGLKNNRPYKNEILLSSYQQLQDAQIFREKDIQAKLDAVYPRIIPLDKSLHFVWEKDHFRLPMLCHFPYGHLQEMLDIDSSCGILYSDVQAYEQANWNEKRKLEIPLPASMRYRDFTSFEQLDYGSRPLVIHDDLYSPELGLQFTTIDNFI
jgi:CRISPR-associated endonuclease/helicase Cas3